MLLRQFRRLAKGYCSEFPIVGGNIITIFFEPQPPPPPPKAMLPHDPHHLKMKPPLKHETPFHEMIPRKSAINNHLKSSQNLWEIRVKKFILSKFGGLQAYSWQLYYQMNSFTGIFQQQHFKLPPCFDLSSSPIKLWGAPSPYVFNTCGKPCCWSFNH